MVPEAEPQPHEHGLVPAGEGWFILNAREGRWRTWPGVGARLSFEGDMHFPQLGINLVVLEPGEPIGMYHAEADLEDFLVLAGEALLLIEGNERPLRTWDFVHCPAWTEHMIIGAGDVRCVVVAVGAREHHGVIRYPVSEPALRRGAGAREATDDPRAAYAHLPPRRWSRYREGWLPDG